MRTSIAVFALVMSACVPQVHYFDPVRVIPTSTPGVAWVHITSETCEVWQGDWRKRVCADYMLLCDARGSTGMKCAIPAEVATARISKHPNIKSSAEPLDVGIGTLGNVMTVQEAASAPAPDVQPTEPPPSVRLNDKKKGGMR